MSTRGQKLIEQASDFGANNYHPLPVVLERGEGVWVWDTEGTRYLDMLASYSALNQGHCHPRLIAALVEQASKLTLTSRAFHNVHLGPFLEKTCKLTGLQAALPMNTGAEAVETAVKAVRKWGYQVKGVPDGQAKIIVCRNNFHGRTTTVISFSSEEAYREGFGPYTPGFEIVEFGDIDAFEAAIDDNTVAFLVEPIQAEAGILLPEAGYFQRVRELCDEHRVLLVLDEIQTGLGRTGKLFAHEWEGIRPDAMTLGKALGGGVLPISAFVANREVMDVFRPGDHGSTFGGNPLACAVAVAAMDVLTGEGLVQRAAELGEWFMGELRALRSPHVREVRGRGLLVGVELHTSARPFCEALMTEGMLCKETHDTVIRFAPPLTITREELEWALPRIGKVLL